MHPKGCREAACCTIDAEQVIMFVCVCLSALECMPSVFLKCINQDTRWCDSTADSVAQEAALLR